MSSVTFEVGEKYENMKGIYEVLAIDGNAMRIRWEDGEEITTRVTLQRRIIDRLNRERNDPESNTTTTEKQSNTMETKKETAISDLESGQNKAVTETSSIKKRYLKTKKLCKVTFNLPISITGDAKDVFVVGDFNDWNSTANPMKKNKAKGFSITLDLEPDREYQFRYLIDGSRWENDSNADKFVKSPYGDSENSVISI